MTVLFRIASHARAAVMNTFNNIQVLCDVDFTSELHRLQARRVRQPLGNGEYSTMRYRLFITEEKCNVYIAALRVFAAATTKELATVTQADSGELRERANTIINSLNTIRSTWNAQLRVVHSRYGRPFFVSEVSSYM